MNRLNEVERMTQIIQSNQSINSICMLTFFGKSSISLTFFWKTFDLVDLFWIFWINSIDSIISVAQSQSTQSPTLWKRIHSVTNQLTWKRNRNDSVNCAEKKNKFKSINSVELIGIQVCILAYFSFLGSWASAEIFLCSPVQGSRVSKDGH